MKKLILAIVALAFAFAISSCCDQAQCVKGKRCVPERDDVKPQGRAQERSYQSENTQQPAQEKQSRRW